MKTEDELDRRITEYYTDKTRTHLPRRDEMKFKNELAFSRAVNKAQSDLTLYKVENRVMPGMPDFYFTDHQGLSGWLELKYCKTKEPPKDLGLNRYQKAWIKNHYEKGGLVFVAVYMAKSDLILFFRQLPTRWKLFDQGDSIQELMNVLCFEEEDFKE